MISIFNKFLGSIRAKVMIGLGIILVVFFTGGLGYFLILEEEHGLFSNILQFHLYLNALFLIFCLAVLFVSYRIYNRLVFQPLFKIQKVLDQDDIAPVKDLVGHQDEFGKVAQMITEYYNQRLELQLKIAELNSAQKEMSDLNDELIAQKFEMEDKNEKLNYLNNEMQAQNEEIITIAEGLHVANKEITDSIAYASFIQNAVLAPAHEMSRIFPDHFIMFRPRNIVSGDFYWFKEMRNGDRILAVADCTGHGLSGALLSMLGISFLNQIMAQFENTGYTAAAILESLRYYFIDSLHQMDEMGNIQDGMHIALCIFNKEGDNMQYATAFHSVLHAMVSSDTGKVELAEYKGNRVPVGIYVTDEKFVSYNVPIQKGDVIYMYSDGVTDQFGGPANKKYMTSNFRDFILSVSNLPLDVQKFKVIHEFEKWKGDYDQTDDVLVVGIRV